jgi:hypothetical protein
VRNDIKEKSQLGLTPMQLHKHYMTNTLSMSAVDIPSVSQVKNITHAEKGQINGIT